jgi:hypothetical protein
VPAWVLSAYTRDMDFFRELKSLTDALAAAGVDYALCGGVALAIHGAPRATQDIDLLVRPESIELFRKTAHACGFTLESFPMDFASGITVQRFTKLIEGQPFMLDALLVGPTTERIWADRQTAEVEGGPMRVVSRQGLMSLKLAAGRPQDLVDVQRLQELDRG